MLPEPLDLRQEVRRYLEVARKIAESELKRVLARHAFMLAQLAEILERSADSAAGQTKLDQYRGMLAEALSTRPLVQSLLLERQALRIESERIKVWRARADELRAMADQFVVPSAKDSLRRAAENYERLAADAEARETDRSPPMDKCG